MVVLMGKGFQISDWNVGGAFGGDSASMNAQARRSRPEAPPTLPVPGSEFRLPSSGGFWVSSSGFRRTVRVMLQLLLLMGILSPVGLTGAEQPTKQVKVKARRFKFVPSRIKVEAGTTLEIILSSQDVQHGFKIVGTDIDVEIPARGKGRSKAVFRTDKAGQYRFECSRVCGAGHSSMRGVIQVAERKKKPPSGPEEGGKRE